MRTCAVVAAAAIVAVAARADANGRFPATNNIHFRPGDLHSMYVQSTFGLLVSHDDGCTFHWICEQAVGFGGTFDPVYRIGSDGTIYAATLYGLQISSDGGCDFPTASLGSSQAAGSGLTDQYLAALDVGPTGEVWVGSTDNGVANALYASSDDGTTWQPRLQSSQQLYTSVVVAPALATRIYATSYQLAAQAGSGSGSGSSATAGAFLFRSDDDGATWNPMPLAGVALGATPLVEVYAVDPGNADIVYLSSVGANPPLGDVLYRSTDAGQTFTSVLQTMSAVHNVTFTDEDHVFLAEYPNADDTGMLTPAPAYASSDGGVTWTQMTGTPELECLVARADGALFGCGQNWIDMKAVAQLQPDGTWSDVFRFAQLAGPSTCPADSAEQQQCAPQWPAVAMQFQATGPTCGSDVGSGSGGAADAGTPVIKRASGCEAGGPATGGLAAALAGVAAVLRRRRRQRRE